MSTMICRRGSAPGRATLHLEDANNELKEWMALQYVTCRKKQFLFCEVGLGAEER